MCVKKGPLQVISFTRSVPAFAPARIYDMPKPAAPRVIRKEENTTSKRIFQLSKSVDSDLDSIQRELSSIDTSDDSVRSSVSSVESYLSNVRSTMQDILDLTGN